MASLGGSGVNVTDGVDIGGLNALLTKLRSDIAELGGGGESLLSLMDTPSSFEGQAAKVLVVNAAEDAVEFVEAPGGGYDGPIKAITFNIAAARAIDPADVEDGDVLQVKHHSVRDDGGGGWFEVVDDGVDAAPVDGGKVFDFTGGGTKRLHRLFAPTGYYSSAWFGIKADGVTDNASALAAWVNAGVHDYTTAIGENYNKTGPKYRLFGGAKSILSSQCVTMPSSIKSWHLDGDSRAVLEITSNDMPGILAEISATANVDPEDPDDPNIGLTQTGGFKVSNLKIRWSTQQTSAHPRSIACALKDSTTTSQIGFAKLEFYRLQFERGWRGISIHPDTQSATKSPPLWQSTIVDIKATQMTGSTLWLYSNGSGPVQNLFALIYYEDWQENTVMDGSEPVVYIKNMYNSELLGLEVVGVHNVAPLVFFGSCLGGTIHRVRFELCDIDTVAHPELNNGERISVRDRWSSFTVSGVGTINCKINLGTDHNFYMLKTGGPAQVECTGWWNWRTGGNGSITGEGKVYMAQGQDPSQIVWDARFWRDEGAEAAGVCLHRNDTRSVTMKNTHRYEWGRTSIDASSVVQLLYPNSAGASVFNQRVANQSGFISRITLRLKALITTGTYRVSAWRWVEGTPVRIATSSLILDAGMTDVGPDGGLVANFSPFYDMDLFLTEGDVFDVRVEETSLGGLNPATIDVDCVMELALMKLQDNTPAP